MLVRVHLLPRLRESTPARYMPELRRRTAAQAAATGGQTGALSRVPRTRSRPRRLPTNERIQRWVQCLIYYASIALGGLGQGICSPASFPRAVVLIAGSPCSPLATARLKGATPRLDGAQQRLALDRHLMCIRRTDQVHLAGGSEYQHIAAGGACFANAYMRRGGGSPVTLDSLSGQRRQVRLQAR